MKPMTAVARRSTTALAAAGVSVLALWLGGCGGSGDSGDQSTTGSAATGSVKTSSAAATTMAGTTASGATTSGAATAGTATSGATTAGATTSATPATAAAGTTTAAGTGAVSTTTTAAATTAAGRGTSPGAVTTTRVTTTPGSTVHASATAGPGGTARVSITPGHGTAAGGTAAAGGTPGAGAATTGGTAVTASAGRPATNFTLKNVQGGTLSLSSLRGKVVLLDFWATWCSPCKLELPDFETLYKKYGPQGLVIIGMTEASSPADQIAAVRKQDGITFPMVYTDAASEAAYHAASGQVPQAALIDRHGNVVAEVTGMPSPSALQYWTPLIEKALKS